MPKETIITKKISSLSLHPDIIEIRPVNTIFVSRYRQAMRQGDIFPPIIIDQKNRIVSGAHRYTAYLDEYGDNHKIFCIQRKYTSEADLIEDAVKENAKHGMPLDGISRRRATLKLSILGRTPEDIARLLGVAVKRIETWGSQTVMVVGNDGKVQTKPVKRGLDHLVGTFVEPEEYKAHISHDRGVPAKELAKQLIRHIDNGWLDPHDPELPGVLSELRGKLAKLSNAKAF